MSNESHYNLSEIKVLVVDDQDPIRKAMIRILNKMGIQNIVECTDGEYALKELVRQPDIDFVLCDIYMRKINGFDVLRYIRHRDIRSDIPVIIVTGEASKEDIVKASDIGADNYIIKPFQAESLITKVNNALNSFFTPPPLLKLLREGDKLLSANKLIKAGMHYKKAMEMDPKSLRARHSYAVCLFRDKKLKEAEELIQENIQLSDSYYRNYATLVDINLSRKNVENAKDLLIKELEFNPKQPRRQNLLAKIYVKEKNFEAAIERYREALKEEVRNLEALVGIGGAFAQTGDLAKAMYYFRRLRRYTPTDSKPLALALKWAAKCNDYAKAELFYKEEISSHSERLDSYVYLSRLYYTTDHLDKAKEVLDKLLAREPEHIEALKVKSAIEMKQNNYANASEILMSICEKKPESDLYIALAECLQKLKKHTECITNLHKALFMNPKNAKGIFLLAQSFQQTGQMTKSLILFQLAKKLGANPDKCNENIQACWPNILNRRNHRQ